MSSSNPNRSTTGLAGFVQSHTLGHLNVDRREPRPLTDSVLHLIWREQQISRAEIARQLGLSRSTVTEIIKDLLQSGFVTEVGIGESSGGRRPIVLEFQNKARIIVGLDIGATHITATIIDLKGEILVTEKIPHPVRSDPTGTRSLIIELVKDCLKQISKGNQRLLSIGVALPSPVDQSHPEWISEVIIPAWQGRSELEQLHKNFGVPVFVDNDANMGALAEYRWGAGQGVEDLTYIKLAYGVGAGFVLQGKVYRGSSGIAGEMGHISIDPEGETCVCGQKGCLATKVGGYALEQRALNLVKTVPDTALKKENLKMVTLINAAIEGDPLANQIYSEVISSLSQAIQGWINMLNPRSIILGGTMAQLGDRLVVPLQQVVSSSALLESTAITQIQVSELGDLAESIGAATLALEEVFSLPGFYKQQSLV